MANNFESRTPWEQGRYYVYFKLNCCSRARQPTPSVPSLFYWLFRLWKMALLSRVRLAFWNSVRSCCISGAPAAGTCNRLRVAICSKGRTSLHLHRQSYCSLPVSCRPGAYAESSRARCPTATWRKSDPDVSHWIFSRFLILQTEPANSLHGYAGHSMLGKLNPVGTARWPDHWRTVAALGWLEALRASNQGVWAPGRSSRSALWL